MSAPAVPMPLRVDRFAASVPEIARAVLARVDADADVRDGEWRDREADLEWLENVLARRIELAGRNVPPGPADLARSAAYFRTAARRGAPLRAMQRLTRASVAHGLTELWARAEPEDVTELLRLSHWIARHNGAVERLLVQVYCEQLDPERAVADRRERLAERLLAGMSDPDEQRAAQCWLVVVLGPDAVESRGPLLRGASAATVDGRRHLVVPVAPAASRGDTWDAVATWVAGQDGLRAAGSFCDDASGIPGTAATARRLLGAATAVALPDGLVGPQDLALETALVAQPGAAAVLAGLLDVLAADGRLLDTLVVFLAHDLDRTRAAAALHLSRGGLSLRLDRIAQLTGLDPRTTRGIQVLGSALAARALRAAGEG